MALVGDPERERTVDMLRGAYMRGYLSTADLEERVSWALAARNQGDLRASVQGIPGGSVELVWATRIEPVVRRHGDAIRGRAANAFWWLAIVVWVATSAILLFTFAVWSLAVGVSVYVAVSFLLIWLALSFPPALVWRKTRHLGRR